MAEQELASGPIPSTLYAGLGGYTGPMISPLWAAKSFWFGLPGEGKSALLQSMPDSYYFNLDRTSTTSPTVKTIIYPGMDPNTGRVIGDDGRPMVLTMDHVNAKLTVLKKLALENQPRPKTVIFDGLSAWIGMLKSWIPDNSVKLGLSREDKASWKFLDGKAAWDLLYDLIVDTINGLHNAGYGVAVIGHVINAKIPLGEDRYLVQPELTITDNFWKRLYHIFEFTGLVYADNREVEYEDKQRTLIRGEEKISIVRKKRIKRKVFVSVAKDQLAGLAKARVQLPPEVEIPRENGWEAFLRVYESAPLIPHDPLSVVLTPAGLKTLAT